MSETPGTAAPAAALPPTPRPSGPRPPASGSPFRRYALMRVALLPAQFLLVLWLIYLAIGLPAYALPANGTSVTITVSVFFHGFAQMVANIFTGQWGSPPQDISYGVYSWFQLYVDFLPNSIQIALFALPIAAVLAYYLGLTVGWTRNKAVDASARFTTLVGGLLPAFIVGLLVEYALFAVFFNTFHDIPGDGIIPSPSWFLNPPNTGFPPWIIHGWVTRPTGFPIVDGIIHQDWEFEAITISKTLMQGIVVALVYVAVFLRHARASVAAARDELHVTQARARGVSESSLLWRHTARRVQPTFLLLFALTIPAYLATQFVVEAVFQDPGIGYLTLTALTAGGLQSFVALEGIMFTLAAFVLVSVCVVDLFAARIDPRGAVAR